MKSNHLTHEKVVKVLEKTPLGQTKFQIRHFVVGEPAHLMHQIRQVVMEIDVREASLHKFKYEAEKRTLQLQLKKETLEKEQANLSETEIQLRQLEIKHEQWKIASQERTLTGHQRDLKYLYDILEELTEDVDVDNMLDHFDELDEEYWVKRLAKQAAVDMATTGRISAGNLAAIELMPQNLQVEALKEAVYLSHQSTQRIQKEIQTQQSSQLQMQQRLNKDLLT